MQQDAPCATVFIMQYSFHLSARADWEQSIGMVLFLQLPASLTLSFHFHAEKGDEH